MIQWVSQQHARGCGVAKAQFMGRFSPTGAVPRVPWPPEPFGDVHLCEVTVQQDSPVNHFVVMLQNGRVLDPLTPERKRLSDYHRVLSVAAVIPTKGIDRA